MVALIFFLSRYSSRKSSSASPPGMFLTSPARSCVHERKAFGFLSESKAHSLNLGCSFEPSKLKILLLAADIAAGIFFLKIESSADELGSTSLTSYGADNENECAGRR